MNSEEMTAGSLSSTPAERRWHAARSRWWNCTGGGSNTTGPKAGNNISAKTGAKAGNIKAGDGGAKFRSEWPEQDEENWEWIRENRIDPTTGKVLPDPEGEIVQCTPEAARIRRILGGGGSGSNSGAVVGGLGQAAREAGRGWVGRWKWWIFGAFVTYLVLSRMVFRQESGEL